MKNIILKDLAEVISLLRELGYNPYISNGELEVEEPITYVQLKNETK